MHRWKSFTVKQLLAGINPIVGWSNVLNLLVIESILGKHIHEGNQIRKYRGFFPDLEIGT